MVDLIRIVTMSCGSFLNEFYNIRGVKMFDTHVLFNVHCLDHIKHCQNGQRMCDVMNICTWSKIVDPGSEIHCAQSVNVTYTLLITVLTNNT